jgi:hypothetical protein
MGARDKRPRAGASLPPWPRVRYAPPVFGTFPTSSA